MELYYSKTIKHTKMIEVFKCNEGFDVYGIALL